MADGILVLLVVLLIGVLETCRILIQYPRSRKIREATDSFARAVLAQRVPSEDVLSTLEGCGQEVDFFRFPSEFTDRFGSCATYADVVRQYREERQSRRREARAVSKHKILVDEFSALVSACSRPWNQMRRTFDRLHRIRLNQSLAEVFKADALNMVMAFSSADDRLSRSLIDFYLALSRTWSKRQTLESCIDELEFTDRAEIRVPWTIQVLEIGDRNIGTNHSKAWAAAFASLVASACSCCKESVAVSATRQKFESLLEPYLERGGPSERNSSARGSEKREQSVVEGALCSECASAYALLELPYGSGQTQVAEARRELAKKFHPDVWGEQRGAQAAEEHLKRVNAACDHLIQCRARS